MLDPKRLLDQFLGAGQTGGPGDVSGAPGGGGPIAGGLGRHIGGFGGGAVVGGLAGLLLGSKQGRKLGGSALKLGGMAVLGGLAYKAYRDWQDGKQPQTAEVGSRTSTTMLPPPRDTPFNPTGEAEQQALGRHLLRAMIAAAKADGHIDATEQASIFARMDALPLAADDKAFVVDELRAPLDVDAVAGSARSPEEAAEIYAASLLAIDVDNAAERGYLAMLAARLKLDEALVQHLHANVAAATQKA